MGKYLKDVVDGLVSFYKGMKITLFHVNKKANTVLYPYVESTTQKNFRGELHNDIDNCIGCKQCSAACPVDCIDIETIKATADVDLGVTTDESHSKKRLYLARFDIDMAKCCYCALCTYACPTGCLVITDKFEYSTPDRSDLIYHFAKMTPEEVAEAQRKLEAEKAAKAAAKAKAAAAKKAAAAAKAAEESKEQAAKPTAKTEKPDSDAKPESSGPARGDTGKDQEK